MTRRRDVLGGIAFAAVAGGASVGASVLRAAQRTVQPGRAGALGALPQRLGEWSLNPQSASLVAPVEFDPAFATALAIYDRTVAASYLATGQPEVMLSIAYMREVRQEQRFHWPEICYASQGFDVTTLAELPRIDGVQDGGRPALGRFIGQSGQRIEFVSYLIMAGKQYVATASQLRKVLFVDSLSLAIPDGFLIRASSIIDRPVLESANGSEEEWNQLSRFFSKFLTYFHGALPAVKYD